MNDLIREAAAVVRAALVGWPETIRLCVVLLVVAAAAVTVQQVFPSASAA